MMGVLAGLFGQWPPSPLTTPRSPGKVSASLSPAVKAGSTGAAGGGRGLARVPDDAVEISQEEAVSLVDGN